MTLKSDFILINIFSCDDATLIFYAKTHFYEDVDFFSKKIILCAKGEDFKKGALDSDFMFVNIEPYKSKKCVPY